MHPFVNPQTGTFKLETYGLRILRLLFTSFGLIRVYLGWLKGGSSKVSDRLG
jgi:hypothetical protein